MSNEIEYYILNGHTPVRATLDEWARWFETADRKVATTEIADSSVSTVFLGMGWDNHLFETMIFGGPHDMYQKRCDTWDEALKMHQTAVDYVLQNKDTQK